MTPLEGARGASDERGWPPLEGARGASDEEAFEKGWVAARVSDPRRDPASVKADVARFAASHEDVDALRRCRVVSCSCASAGLVADALEARAGAEAREKGPGGKNAEGDPDPDRLSRRDGKGKTYTSSSFSPLDFFTHVFFDEAGQATVPEALVPLARLASVKTRAFVLAGDPRQLGPTVHSAASAREGLGTSPLEHFPGGFARTVRLVENYRSHADVLDLPSRLFYDASLVARATSEVTRLPASLVDRREPEDRGDATKGGSVSDDGRTPRAGSLLRRAGRADARGGRRGAVVFQRARGARARRAPRVLARSRRWSVGRRGCPPRVGRGRHRAVQGAGDSPPAIASREGLGRGARGHRRRLPGPGGTRRVHLLRADESADRRGTARRKRKRNGRRETAGGVGSDAPPRVPGVSSSVQRRGESREGAERRRRPPGGPRDVAALARAPQALHRARGVRRRGRGVDPGGRRGGRRSGG